LISSINIKLSQIDVSIPILEKNSWNWVKFKLNWLSFLDSDSIESNLSPFVNSSIFFKASSIQFLSWFNVDFLRHWLKMISSTVYRTKFPKSAVVFMKSSKLFY
jgi:hypothetical protein